MIMNSDQPITASNVLCHKLPSTASVASITSVSVAIVGISPSIVGACVTIIVVSVAIIVVI